MKSLFKLINVTALLCVALCVSCEKTDDMAGAGVSIDEESLEVNFSGKSSVPVEVAFTAYQNWEAKTDAEWLDITPSSGGAGNFIVSFDAAVNETGENRSATVNILSGGKTSSIAVNQSKINVLTIDGEDSFKVDGLANEVDVEFTTNNSYEINIPSTDEWVSLVETKSADSYVRKFAVEANPNFLPRTSTITISNSEIGISETITITQAGKPVITIDADPAEYELTYLPQEHTVELFSTVDYEVAIDEKDQEWLSAVKAEDGQSITFKVAENIGGSVKESIVALVCDEKFNINQTIKIVQRPFDVVITVDPATLDLPRTNGTFDVTVNSNVDVKAVITADWVRETSCQATGVEGEWLYSFEYDANNILDVRTANINFYNEEKDKGADVVISQEKMLNTAIITVKAVNTLTAKVNELSDLAQYTAVTIIGDGVALSPTDLISLKLFTSARIVDISQTGTKLIQGEAFANNTHIEEFIFPNTLTTLQGTAFMASALTKVTIPGSVTTWGNAVFNGCKKLKEVRIEEGCTSIGQQAFLNNAALETIYIPSTIEEWLTIGEVKENKAFGQCSSLKNIHFAEGLKRIGTMSFFGCKALTEVTIPGSIIDWPVSKSGVNNCFTGCSNLKTVTLNDGLYGVEHTAFNGLAVTSITSYSATPPTMQASGIPASANVKVYVPASYITAYTATGFWTICTVSALEE